MGSGVKWYDLRTKLNFLCVTSADLCVLCGKVFLSSSPQRTQRSAEVTQRKTICFVSPQPGNRMDDL